MLYNSSSQGNSSTVGESGPNTSTGTSGTSNGLSSNTAPLDSSPNNTSESLKQSPAILYPQRNTANESAVAS